MGHMMNVEQKQMVQSHRYLTEMESTCYLLMNWTCAFPKKMTQNGCCEKALVSDAGACSGHLIE